ncbi:accessory factor UbiK family protein [Pinisolibacter aquiterrae]|uniref:accessory factor UbiK family protein n=1 Tax=Pinisolibacter aquiterrae TaxID=2815579 RepID=UPI001C3D2D16|nr:accessory factor UbiK family protein [Pinisolibacter aquiterrae]MBV5263364.1 accessory factor UbiK family protein [Pinisolibacter aquiterrae]MCC8237558.1 accessory factor UbiK family protein [Pinisolibacter aquiterrae]
MTQTSNRFFDDIAKLMTDAAGVAQGFGKEVETAVRARAESFVTDMDLVKREDYEVVREMAAKARAENEALSARLDALEARLAKLEGGKSNLSETLIAGGDPAAPMIG